MCRAGRKTTHSLTLPERMCIFIFLFQHVYRFDNVQVLVMMVTRCKCTKTCIEYTHSGPQIKSYSFLILQCLMLLVEPINTTTPIIRIGGPKLT